MGEEFSVIRIAENRGFTLLELMITLLIAGIILSIGVPSFRGVMQNQRMTSATNELVMSLNLAKSEAIKRVVYVSVCKSSNGVTCGDAATSWRDGWIVFANATVANLGVRDFGDELIRVYPSLRSEFALTPIGTVDGFISFRPSGTMGTAVANSMAITATTITSSISVMPPAVIASALLNMSVSSILSAVPAMKHVHILRLVQNQDRYRLYRF